MFLLISSKFLVFLKMLRKLFLILVDPRTNAVYFYSRIESSIVLPVIFIPTLIGHQLSYKLYNFYEISK